MTTVILAPGLSRRKDPNRTAENETKIKDNYNNSNNSDHDASSRRLVFFVRQATYIREFTSHERVQNSFQTGSGPVPAPGSKGRAPRAPFPAQLYHKIPSNRRHPPARSSTGGRSPNRSGSLSLSLHLTRACFSTPCKRATAQCYIHVPLPQHSQATAQVNLRILHFRLLQYVCPDVLWRLTPSYSMRDWNVDIVRLRPFISNMTFPR